MHENAPLTPFWQADNSSVCVDDFYNAGRVSIQNCTPSEKQILKYSIT